MVKAIIFDLDGTLANTLKYSLSTLMRVMKSHGLKAKKREVLDLYGEPAKEILRNFIERSGKKLSPEKLVLEQEALQLKLMTEKDLFFAGAEAVLRQLKRKGYLLGLVTGSSKVIACAELLPRQEKLFDVMVTASDVRRGKPFPDQIVKALNSLGVDSSDALLVGDSVMDLWAAENSSVRAVAVSSGSSLKADLLREKPLAVLSSVKKLPGFLKALEKKERKNWKAAKVRLKASKS